MNKSTFDNHRVIAASVCGLSLVLMLFALIAGGTQSLSPGTPLDPRIVSEFQHLVVAPHAEKIRVERPLFGANITSETDHDAPDWLPADQPDFYAAGATQPLFLTSFRCGAGSCRGFLRPLLRAPPLA